MPKFRKKPVVIEALNWECTEESYFAICELAQGVQVEGDGAGNLLVHTLEGVMRADPADWIIKGVKGEIYPCKPDIFEQTYEPVVMSFDDMRS